MKCYQDYGYCSCFTKAIEKVNSISDYDAEDIRITLVLSEIDSKDIVIIINDYEEFLCLDLLSKRKIKENFEQSILLWWELEVCDCMVEGKIRKFTVYLVF